jgi:hypothetical protein
MRQEGPTLPLESTQTKGIRSRMVLERCELASLVRGLLDFPRRTRVTCVNLGPSPLSDWQKGLSPMDMDSADGHLVEH